MNVAPATVVLNQAAIPVPRTLSNAEVFAAAANGSGNGRMTWTPERLLALMECYNSVLDGTTVLADGSIGRSPAAMEIEGGILRDNGFIAVARLLTIRLYSAEGAVFCITSNSTKSQFAILKGFLKVRVHLFFVCNFSAVVV